jgi:hypothetical protein
MQQQRQRKSASYRFGLPIVDDEMLENRVVLNSELETIVRESMLLATGLWMYRTTSRDTSYITRKCARVRHVIDKIRGD